VRKPNGPLSEGRFMCAKRMKASSIAEGRAPFLLEKGPALLAKRGPRFARPDGGNLA